MTVRESSADGALRWIFVAVMFASALLIVPSATEPFMLPKATALLTLTVLAVFWAASESFLQRRVGVNVSAPAMLAFVLAAVLVAVTLTSTDRLTSLTGWYGRYAGLVMYLVYLLIFLLVASRFDTPLASWLRRAVVVAVACVVGYGFLQAAGADPVGWVDQGLGTTFSFMGNVDFAAAWTGAAFALVITTAWSDREPPAWRLFALVLVPLTLVYVYLTHTSQGPVVALVSAVWAAGVLSAAPDSMIRAWAVRRRRTVIVAGAVACAVVAGGVWLGLGVIRAQLSQALVERPDFWRTALSIFGDHPLVGTGLATYGDFFLPYRPASHAVANGPVTADGPHSVPLAMLANGGIVLFVAYLAFVVAVGSTLVRGTLRASGHDRLVLAGFGGVWWGYQVQSLVSYDVPPLAVLHYLSAGVIVAVVAQRRVRELRLPGPVPTRAVTRRGKEYGPLQVPASTRGFQALAGVLAAATIWFGLYPLRADLVAASAAPLGRTGQLDAAIARLQEASQLNPAEDYYVFLEARAQAAAHRPSAALQSATRAAHMQPGAVDYAVFAGQEAQLAGNLKLAQHWYTEAVTRDPRDPKVLAVVANYFVQSHQPQVAREYLQKALRLDPQSSEALQVQQELQQQATG